jgi:hypothetical protein
VLIGAPTRSYRLAHEQPFSRRETQPAAVSGCDPSEKVIARRWRIAKAARRLDEQPQNQTGLRRAIW